MPKWCQFGRCFVQSRGCEVFVKSILVVLCLAVIINFFITYGYYNYAHVPSYEIDAALYKEAVPALWDNDIPDCTYEHILQNTHTIQPWEVPNNYDDFDAKGIVNGSFTPSHCKPLFSVAVLVTYRNRQRQLDIFLPYIHNFLRKQNIHYKIYLIEQEDEKPWNKGLLYNMGARQALAERFPCLVLHDVDLLPLDAGNLYACSHLPRHLSASIDSFRYVLPYEGLAGGVLALRADHYARVDGFSNRFLNWGGEDDDFYMRLAEHGLKVTRFPRHVSRYTMLRHGRAARNPARFSQVARNRREREGGAARAHDGLAHAPRLVAALRAQPQRLFTRIAVAT